MNDDHPRRHAALPREGWNASDPTCTNASMDLNGGRLNLTPDPRNLVLFPSHEEALATLGHGLSARKGIILLLGEAGTGKTTLLRKVRASLGSHGCLVVLNNPTLTRDEFVEFVNGGFDLRADARTSKVQLLHELTRRLNELDRKDVCPGLVVDEAHRMPYELLQEIHLLTNTETESGTLLPVVLSGQPELGARLNEPGLRQLKQRVGLRHTLPTLDLQGVARLWPGRRRSKAPAERLLPRGQEGPSRCRPVSCRSPRG